MDFICAKMLHRSKKLHVLRKIEGYLDKKTSIEFILIKLLEFEKAKFALFSKDEILGMKLMSKPDIHTVMGDPIGRKIQEKWRVNEMASEVTDKDMKQIVENSGAETPLTHIQKNILELLE